jgi:hypothetical protein
MKPAPVMAIDMLGSAGQPVERAVMVVKRIAP